MKHCCEMMETQINHKCDQHEDPFDCPDNLIYYSVKSDEYGIIIHDADLLIHIYNTALIVAASYHTLKGIYGLIYLRNLVFIHLLNRVFQKNLLQIDGTKTAK